MRKNILTQTPHVSKPVILLVVVLLASLLIVTFLKINSLKVVSPLTPTETENDTNNNKFTRNVNFEYLNKDIVYHGPTNKKLLALTFDADMTPGMKLRLTKGEVKTWYNQGVIDVLKQTQTPATLFLTGLWIETYPVESKQLAENPLFELGNHSYSHHAFNKPCFNLTPVPDDQKVAEIDKTQALLKKLTGKDNIFFRFPGGCYSQNDLVLAKSLGVLPIEWNSFGPDSFNDDVAGIVKNLNRLTQNGAIIVLHMHGGKNAPKTAEVIKQYIPLAIAKGYTFVKLSELLK